MLTGRLILLLASLLSTPCWAGAAFDLGFGKSLSGNFNTGKSLPSEQQSFSFSIDYVGKLRRGLLGCSNERYGLGLGVYTAQVNYTAGQTKNTGGNFFLTARTGWLILAFNKSWLIHFTPEFVLFSRLSAASYSQSTIDGENFQSASLSTYTGNGSIRLPLYVGKKLKWKLGASDLYLGSSLSYLMQNFSKREDTVIATSPSTGKASSIEKTSTGAFSLQTLSIEFHLTFMM